MRKSTFSWLRHARRDVIMSVFLVSLAKPYYRRTNRCHFHCRRVKEKITYHTDAFTRTHTHVIIVRMRSHVHTGCLVQYITLIIFLVNSRYFYTFFLNFMLKSKIQNFCKIKFQIIFFLCIWFSKKLLAIACYWEN